MDKEPSKKIETTGKVNMGELMKKITKFSKKKILSSTISKVKKKGAIVVYFIVGILDIF